jgi:hypothetical protein
VVYRGHLKAIPGHACTDGAIRVFVYEICVVDRQLNAQLSTALDSTSIAFPWLGLYKYAADLCNGVAIMLKL